MQRYAISLMLKEKKTQVAMAEAIGVNKSTISRELKRNSTNGKYHYTTAQELCEIRKERLRQPRKFNGEIRNRIDRKLREEDWSPEQIEGWSKLHGYAMVSKSRIYEYIHKDKEEGGDLWTHCRFKLKHRKKPVGKSTPIKNRVGIEERPAEADGTRFGDWEMDLIVGPGNKGAKLTLVERSLSFVIIRNLPCGKVPSEVSKVVVDALLPFKRSGAVKTITTDNGPEFADHETISRHLGAAVYFADPYSSWQKGLIENTNMLIRQYIPRDENFSKLTDEQVAAIQYKINRRPRKKLGFRIPYQEFYLSLQT